MLKRIPREIPIIFSLLILIFANGVVFAENASSKSTHYGVNEVFFGSGGNLDECSVSYCAKVAIGEQTVGNPTSTNYQVRAGFNTTDEPTLEFFVNGGTVNLGLLNTTNTGSGSVTFSVLDYVSSGYTVILSGTPPQYKLPTGSEYTLAPMTSAAAASPGTEQFGVNLVANNVSSATPHIFGAGVQQVPDSTFGFGTPSAGYNTANQFKFNDGDIVASSSKASGESLYTLSMIADISQSTPGGLYSGTMGLVAVATF